MFKAKATITGTTISLGEFSSEAVRDKVMDIYMAYFGEYGRWSNDLSDRLALGIPAKEVERYAQQAIIDNLLLGAK